MKRLIDIPDEIDKEFIRLNKKLGYPITQIIKRIFWEWYEKNKEEQ